MIDVAIETQNEETDLTLHLEARLCAVIMNANGAKTENRERFEMKHFLPDERRSTQKMTPEQYEYALRMKTISAGGTVIYQ